MLLPSIYREALESVGADAGALDLARCNPSYAVHFDDGLPTPLEIGGDAACERNLREQMDGVEPGAYAAYTQYLESARANLASGLPIFIKEQFDGASLSTLPRFLRSALLGGGAGAGETSPLRDWPLRSHGGQLADLFDAGRHRELAAFQDLYVGLSPDSAPAVFSLLQAIELPSPEDDDSGVFYPRGGWGTVRDALLRAVEANGVECRWGTHAAEVVVRDGAVRGVRVGAAAAGGGGAARRGDDPSDEFHANFGANAAAPAPAARRCSPPTSWWSTPTSRRPSARCWRRRSAAPSTQRVPSWAPPTSCGRSAARCGRRRRRWRWRRRRRWARRRPAARSRRRRWRRRRRRRAKGCCAPAAGDTRRRP